MPDHDTPPLIELSSQLLRGMFAEEEALFAYSTRLEAGRYVNDFSHPARYRYTINSLAGIQRAQRFYQLGWETGPLLDRFLALHGRAVEHEADRGLLLYVMTEAAHPARHELFERLEQIVADRERMLGLDVQAVCWMLMGLVRYGAATGGERERAVAERCFKHLNRHFFNRDTLLPFHRLARYRRDFVSFGGIVYFLRALYDYAAAFHDLYAETIFREGVRQVIALQGERGEWPWFVDAGRARVLDWYQVYSVHQDSMAMLFLLPALDLGVAEARGAIEKSYRWLFGANELQAPMVVGAPFFIYRSIRRREKYERERRYLRALFGQSFSPGHARPAPPATLEVNRECRSYHIGWILFAWAGREDFSELTELRPLARARRAEDAHLD